MKLGLGESAGAFRAVHFGKTEADAVALLRDTNYAGFQNYFGGFGFWEAFLTPEDAATYPLDPYTPLPPSEWTVERMRRVKDGLAGTVDQVKAEIAGLRTIGGGGDLEGRGNLEGGLFGVERKGFPPPALPSHGVIARRIANARAAFCVASVQSRQYPEN